MTKSDRIPIMPGKEFVGYGRHRLQWRTDAAGLEIVRIVDDPVYTLTSCTVEATRPGDRMKQVDLDPDVWSACMRRAEKDGTDASVVIREAVLRYLGDEHDDNK